MDYGPQKFPDVVSLEVEMQMWIILILAYNLQIMAIIHRLYHNSDFKKNWCAPLGPLRTLRKNFSEQDFIPIIHGL